MSPQIFFAKLSWILLIIILIARPLNDIYKNKLLLFVLRYRKQLGVICGLSAFLHVIIFLVNARGLKDFFVNSLYWRFDNFFGWGSLALILIILPLITSNNFSIKLLKNNWKRIQRLSYLVLIMTAVHVALVKNDFIIGLWPVALWLVIWLVAYFKKKQV